jgi:threonine dehydratase
MTQPSQPPLVSLQDIEAAAAEIAGKLIRTPAVESPGIGGMLGCPVALKLELLQKTGCFKPRGIVNRLMAMPDDEARRGVVTVSGGNHGIAIAWLGQQLGLGVTVVMSEKAPKRSQERIKASGATLILTPDAGTAFERAELLAQEKGLTYIHSYDDPLIIAGHGTVGLEFIADVPSLTDVLISIGGGGLISGCAVAIKAANPKIRIWGVETEGAEAMRQAIDAAKPVKVSVTSIATTLGAPSVSARTLAHAQALVEDVLVVSDAEAVRGVVSLAEEAKVWAEPAAGCLIPAARRVLDRVGKKAGAKPVLGMVICGGNVAFSDVAGWIEQFGLRN